MVDEDGKAAPVPAPQASRLRELRAIAMAELVLKDGGFDVWGYLDQVKEVKVRPLTADWLEAYVAICVIGRVRPARATGFLRQLRDVRMAENRLDLFDAYRARISDHLYPDVMTNHGFKAANFEGIDHAEVWDHVGTLMSRLEAEGFQVFLNSGTLLGVTRDRALIGHDDDVDLAVVLDAADADEAARKWKAVTAWVKKNDLWDKNAQRNPEILKLKRVGDVQIDLFPAWVQDGRAFVYPHTHGDLDADDVLPLRRCEVTGYKVPRHPEKMLALNYGAGWQVPDPLFKFPWAPANEKFAGFLERVRG